MDRIKSNHLFVGIFFILVSSLGFALMSLFVKLAGTDIPSIQAVLFRNSVSMIVSIGMVLYYKKGFTYLKSNHKYLLVRSALGTVGMVMFFYSISRIPLADANMINKLSSFFLIGFSAVFLRESVKLYQVIAIIIAFLGTILVFRPTFEVDLISYFAALVAAMFAGAAYTMLRFLRDKVVYYKIVLYFSTFSVVVLAPFVLLNYVPMTSMQLLYLILAGTFATVGQFGITLAYRFAQASDISIYNYSNVVFASILAFFFIGEVIKPLSLLGYLIIFSASYYMFVINKRKGI